MFQKNENGEYINKSGVPLAFGKTRRTYSLVVCPCGCNISHPVLNHNLINGASRGYIVGHGRPATSHGHSKRGKVTGTYNSWLGMKQRCEYVNHIAYDRYGGRGIAVCDRWQVFANFLADMGERPHRKSIDRIDNEGDYCPQNCRWATATEQQANKRRKPSGVSH